MPPKGRKKRNNQLASAINAAAAEGESPNVANDEEKKKSSNKSMGCDIFSDSAMENAYYTCHNIQDVLKSRGFAWPDGQKKKKKGKR